MSEQRSSTIIRKSTFMRLLTVDNINMLLDGIMLLFRQLTVPTVYSIAPLPHFDLLITQCSAHSSYHSIAEVLYVTVKAMGFRTK